MHVHMWREFTALLHRFVGKFKVPNWKKSRNNSVFFFFLHEEEEELNADVAFLKGRVLCQTLHQANAIVFLF